MDRSKLTPHQLRMLDDPEYARRHHEAITAFLDEASRTEGRLVLSKTPSHVNPHDN